MQLKTRIFTIFTAALLINVIAIIFGLTTALHNLSEKLMKKQAENMAMFLQNRIIELHKSGNLNESQLKEEILKDFLIASKVAEESRGFELRKILLITPDFRVLAAHPESEIGKDYSAHADIREMFHKKRMETVLESVSGEKNTNSDTPMDVDVVSWFSPDGQKELVLEVKIDFAKSLSLLEEQSRYIEIAAVAVAILLLVGLLTILLYLINRVAVIPVRKVALAMDQVATGNLDVRLADQSRDEFGVLALRFNEMVAGLKEKLQLSRYVSRGTVEAVRHSIQSGVRHHVSERKKLVIFFSDIRGFTTYSESRDPAEVVDVLNKILTLQAKVIKKHNGDIDKLVGDEVMALFETPGAAIEASIEIQKGMISSSSDHDGLMIGIGIYEGEVIHGDIGSEEIKDYTVIGDSVNIAARLQSLASGGEILIPRGIAESLAAHPGYVAHLKGFLKMKGKEEAIETYNIVYDMVS